MYELRMIGHHCRVAVYNVLHAVCVLSSVSQS